MEDSPGGDGGEEDPGGCEHGGRRGACADLCLSASGVDPGEVPGSFGVLREGGGGSGGGGVDDISEFEAGEGAGYCDSGFRAAADDCAGGVDGGSVESAVVSHPGGLCGGFLGAVDRCGSDELAEAAGAGGPRGEPGGCGDLRRDLYHGAGVGAAGAAADMRGRIGQRLFGSAFRLALGG